LVREKVHKFTGFNLCTCLPQADLWQHYKIIRKSIVVVINISNYENQDKPIVVSGYWNITISILHALQQA
jgi:hypothetical protein